MSERDDIFELLLAGDAWAVAQALVELTEAEFAALGGRIVKSAGGRGEALEILAVLVAVPAVPAGAPERERLARLEGLRMLAAAVAHEIIDESWGDFAHALKALAIDPSFRVREWAVRLVARIASASFKESKAFWRECIEQGEGFLVAAVLRGLAVSSAPVIDVLDLFTRAMPDIRKDVRHVLGTRAIPDLGRREPREVYIRLRQWARSENEITRWNVAHALATPLGAAFPDEAMEILEWLAGDERPGVWRAAAAAIVEIAQRKPAFVLPILKRWRDDPMFARCAKHALETLARR
jgi:hypothetical protein